jgi:hypothetical protein
MKRVTGIAIQVLILALAVFAEKAPALSPAPVPQNDSTLTDILTSAVAARTAAALNVSPEVIPGAAETTADSPSPVDIEVAPEPPKEISLPAAYARMDENGAIIAGKAEWYLEEPDAQGRPSTGIVWKDGKVARQISWLYYGDTVRLMVKVETDEARTIESNYDRDGNETSSVTTDAKGIVTARTENAYGKNGKIATATVEKDGKKTRTEYAYAKDGALSQKKIIINDSLSSEFIYKDDNNWTEKVYKNDKIVLVLTYENGVRQGKK